MTCPHHEGHNMFTLWYDGSNFEKTTFDSWLKTNMAHSVCGRVASDENHMKTRRPWEAFYDLVGRATTRSETKTSFAELGMSLHKSTSKEMYNLQFICRACNRTTNPLYPIASDEDLRAEADRTMLAVYSKYFDTVGPTKPDFDTVGPTKPELKKMVVPPPPPPQWPCQPTNVLPPPPPLDYAPSASGASTASVSTDISTYAPSISVYRCYWHDLRNQSPASTEYKSWTGDGRGETWTWRWTGDGRNDWTWTWN